MEWKECIGKARIRKAPKEIVLIDQFLERLFIEPQSVHQTVAPKRTLPGKDRSVGDRTFNRATVVTVGHSGFNKCSGDGRIAKRKRVGTGLARKQEAAVCIDGFGPVVPKWIDADAIQCDENHSPHGASFLATGANAAINRLAGTQR